MKKFLIILSIILFSLSISTCMDPISIGDGWWREYEDNCACDIAGGPINGCDCGDCDGNGCNCTLWDNCGCTPMPPCNPRFCNCMDLYGECNCGHDNPNNGCYGYNPCECDDGNPNCDCDNKLYCDCNNGCNCTAPITCNCTDTNKDNCDCNGIDCQCALIPTNPPSFTWGFAATRNTLIDTSVFLTENGEVWVWGFRGSGQQGNGTMAIGETRAPARVMGLPKIVHVTGSAYSLAAIDIDGNVWGWGQNLHGATGISQIGTINSPEQVPIPVKVDQLAAGEYFMIARGIDGTVWVWGHDNFGQMGQRNSIITNRNNPIQVTGIGNVRLIGASYEGAFAINNDNKVFVWGRNASGSLGLPGDLNGNYLIERRPTPTESTALSGYASQIEYIAGGYRHGHALLNNGDIIAWGENNRIARSGTGWTHNPIFIQIPSPLAGEKWASLHSRFISTVAITNMGRVFTWGSEGYNVGGASVILRATNVTDLGGGKHNVLFARGNNLFGAGYAAGHKFIEPLPAPRPWTAERLNINF